MCLHCIGKVSNCSIKRCGRSWSADKGTIYCLSSHSCHFCQKYFFLEPESFMRMFNVSTLYSKVSNCSIKVNKGAKIRNQYNQVPHLTQDTNGKVTNSQSDTTKESQEVSPFPAGDHKAHILGQKRNAAYKDWKYCVLNESYKMSYAIYVSLLFLPHNIPIVSLSSVNPNQCTGCLFIFKFFMCTFILFRFTHVITTEITKSNILLAWKHF